MGCCLIKDLRGWGLPVNGAAKAFELHFGGAKINEKTDIADTISTANYFLCDRIYVRRRHDQLL